MMVNWTKRGWREWGLGECFIELGFYMFFMFSGKKVNRVFFGVCFKYLRKSN